MGSHPKLARQTLRGVWVALITPWGAHDELDEARYAKEIRSFDGTGVHGLYTGGTTGEFYAQDDDTFERVCAITCEIGHATGLPVQIGVSALSTRTVNKRIRLAQQHGADGVQVALPFWLQLRDDEVVRFMREIAQQAGDTPIILYQTSRAKLKIAPDLLGQLADEIPTFIGTKDTGCTVEQLTAMLKAAPTLSIFGGDGDMLPKMRAGGKGIYAAVTGINPWRMARLYELCAAGRYEEAQPIQTEIRRLLDEVLIPICINDGLEDSAIDRIQRTVGGGDVGLRSQSPYRSGTQHHVEQVIHWCKANAPALLDKSSLHGKEPSI